MDYEIRPVREGDIEHLSQNIRPEDLQEILAATGNKDPYPGLRYSVENSEEALAGALTGGPAEVLWGISPFSDRAALIWAIASAEVDNHKIAFLRNSRSVIARWFEERPNVEYLVNFTHGENTVHHKWLEWLGATLYPPTPVGPLLEGFRPFMIPRKKFDNV